MAAIAPVGRGSGVSGAVANLLNLKVDAVVKRAVGANAAGSGVAGRVAGKVPALSRELNSDALAVLRSLGAGACNAKLTVDGESKDYNTASSAHKIHPFCEEQGIQFSCIEGTCGTCAVDVVKGAEKLNQLTKPEHDFFAGDAGNKRLACQVQIKQGASGDIEVEK